MRQAASCVRAQTCFARRAPVSCPRKLGREIDQARAHKSAQPCARPLHIALRSQRQKTAQSRQCQSLHMAGASDAARSDGRLPKLSHLPFSQTKRRLQRRVKPVFARCHRDVIANRSNLGWRVPHSHAKHPNRAKTRRNRPRAHSAAHSKLQIESMT